MRFVVHERVAVVDDAGASVVGGDVERVAERRGERARSEHALGDERGAANGERVNAVGRTDVEAARLREAFLRRVGAVGEIILVHGHVAAIGCWREVGDIGRGVADGDGESGGGGVAVAVAQRVGENLVHATRRACVAGVAVSAVGVERERSILAREREVAAAVRRGVHVGGHVDARDAEHRRAVRALRVRTAVQFGVGDHIARCRAKSGRRNRVGVVHRVRRVVIEQNADISTRGITGGVGDNDADIEEKIVLRPGHRMTQRHQQIELVGTGRDIGDLQGEHDIAVGRIHARQRVRSVVPHRLDVVERKGLQPCVVRGDQHDIAGAVGAEAQAIERAAECHRTIFQIAGTARVAAGKSIFIHRHRSGVRGD